MMFLLGVRLVSVDIGSQFYKFAESTSDGQVRIIRDKITNSVSVPTAAGIKFQVQHELPLTGRQFEDIEVYSGRKAVKLLKNNQSLGLEYPTRLAGRNNSGEFFTATVANATELFQISLVRAIQSLAPFGGFTVGIPSFMSRSQMGVITETARLFQLPIVGVVDDVTAVTTLYSTMRLGRFKDRPKQIMFIDIGATSVKAYAGVFMYDRSNPSHEFVMVNITGNDWSEETGGYFFAKAMAESREIPHKQAMKSLQNTGGEGCEFELDDQLEAMAGVVRHVMDDALKFGPIDEVQLIGGASTLRVVVDKIKTVTNRTIRRDFNANEAVAMGTLITTMLTEGNSPYVDTYVRTRAALTLDVVCGNKTASYCVKGEMYEQKVEFTDLEDYCDTISIVGADDGRPKDTNPTMVTYKLTEKPKFEGEGLFKLRIVLEGMAALAQAVEICQNGTCAVVPIEATPASPAGYLEATEFINRYSESRGSKEARQSIRDTLEKLNAWLVKIDRANVEATYPATDEMRKTIADANAHVEQDNLESLEYRDLVSMQTSLEKVTKSLHISKN